MARLPLFCVLAGLVVPANAAAATLEADYDFAGNLNSSVAGAPALTDVGPGPASVFGTEGGRTIRLFAADNGFSLPDTSFLASKETYSVVVDFKFSATTGYRRILNPLGGVGAADTGIYNSSGAYAFYDQLDVGGISGVEGPAGAIAENEYVQVAFTRDATGDASVGYVNGVEHWAYADVNNGMRLDAANGELQFFKDDGAEESGGLVDRIRVFDGALTPAEAQALAPAAPPVEQPVPADSGAGSTTPALPPVTPAKTTTPAATAPAKKTALKCKKGYVKKTVKKGKKKTVKCVKKKKARKKT